MWRDEIEEDQKAPTSTGTRRTGVLRKRGPTTKRRQKNRMRVSFEDDQSSSEDSDSENVPEVSGRQLSTVSSKKRAHLELEDPRFTPRIKWIRSLYTGIKRGNLAVVQSIFSPNNHASAINHRLFDMGFSAGGGSTMHVRECSSALHLAAWCGQSDIVRWLMNHGASTEVRDGLHQLPIEVASTLDVRRVLGAASSIIDLNDKVETVELAMRDNLTHVGDRFAVKLARLYGELAEIDYKIETTVKDVAREEVMELRAALARQLDRAIRRYRRSQREIRTDPEVWKRIEDAESIRDDVAKLRHDLETLIERLDHLEDGGGRRMRVGEVESAGPQAAQGSSRTLRQLQSTVKKNKIAIDAKDEKLHDMGEDIQRLRAELQDLRNAHKLASSRGGCCIVM